MFLDFAPGGGDFVHVLFIAKERRLWNPDGLESGAVRHWIWRLQKSMGFGGLGAAETLAIFTALENVERVERRVAGLIRNAFRVDGLDELMGVRRGEVLRINVENVGVVTVARAPRIELLRRDPRNLRQQLIQKARILVASSGLAIETGELHAENGPLPLTQTIV